MENNDDQMDDYEEEETGTMKQWFQDNLRIIISIVIVVLIAGGIYSYSKRSAAPSAEEQGEQSTISEELNGSGSISDQGETAANDKKSEEKTTATKPAIQTAPAGQSQETDGSFVETAAHGDSMTKLARRALANYLEKNPDSALTAEHKIYIEDYLRKNVPKKSIHVGTSVEFSKDLINGAISKAKTLNDNQLNNLHKYAVRVPSLS